MNQRRAVITGLGAVTPLGESIDGIWENLLAGNSGVRKITLFDASELPCQIAGEIPDFDPSRYMEKMTGWYHLGLSDLHAIIG